VLADLEPDEALALDGLPWPGRPRTVLPGKPFTTTLSRLEAAVSAAGGELGAILSRTVGAPLRDLPAESRAERTRRREFGAWLESHPLVRPHPGLREWVAHVRRTGVVGPDHRALVASALEITGGLPRSPLVARSTLAAQLLEADAHALDSDTALGRLCTTLLSWRRDGVDRPLDPIETRELWLAHGVEVDPLSCTVLSIGLAPAGATPLARALRSLRGQAVVLTYAQLCAAPPTWSSGTNVFTCENPVVIRAAEHALGASCPPLLCTGGWPNAAVLTLLDGVHRAGAAIHHHGDGDPAGFAILEHLTKRVNAVSWRLTPPAEPQVPCAHDDQPPHVAVPEELALETLLADLHRAAAS